MKMTLHGMCTRFVVKTLVCLWVLVCAGLLLDVHLVQAQSFGSTLRITRGPSPSPAVVGNTVRTRWEVEVTGDPKSRAECLTSKATWNWTLEYFRYIDASGNVTDLPRTQLNPADFGNARIVDTEFVGAQVGRYELSLRVTGSYNGGECGGPWNNGGGVALSSTVEVKNFVLHPVNNDFGGDAAPGRILISKQRTDDTFYTVVPTTKADQPAQTANAQVTITAHLPVSAEGQTVYFRLVNPSPIDASPYSALDPSAPVGGEDNVGGVGTLTLNQDTATLTTINNNQVAAAETVLRITQQHSGDNYLTQASLDSAFQAGVVQTCVMVAWKRCYLEVDPMYKQGATVTQAFIPVAGIGESTLAVDSTADITAYHSRNGRFPRLVIFFKDGPQLVTLFREIEGPNKVTSTTVTVAHIGRVIPRFAGVKFEDSSEGYEAHTGLLTKGFGSATDGSDGGGFVEWKFPVPESHVIPKYGAVPDFPTGKALFEAWFVAHPNLFQLVSASRFSNPSFTYTGRTWSTSHISSLFVENYSPSFLHTGGTLANGLAELTVHELGHQFWLPRNYHVDLNQFNIDEEGEIAYSPAPQIGTPLVTNNDCVMSYEHKAGVGDAKFDVLCYREIRKALDPR